MYELDSNPIEYRRLGGPVNVVQGAARYVPRITSARGAYLRARMLDNEARPEEDRLSFIRFSGPGPGRGLLMGKFSFDTSQWPLVVFTAVGALEDHELDAHFKEYLALLRRNKPYVIFMDTTQMTSTTAMFRKRYAEFFKTNETVLKHLCKGGALVITSGIVRGTLTAVLWLTPMPFPHKIVATKEEALAWLRSQLSAADR
jgi:hypothetical protein